MLGCFRQFLGTHHLINKLNTIHVILTDVNGASLILLSLLITWIVFSLLIRWCVPTSCLKWPSKNSLSHFYKRCVSVPMLPSFLYRSNDSPLTSSNIPYFVGSINKTVCQCYLSFFLYRSHDAESTNRSYIFLISWVSLSSGFLYLVTNTL